MTIKTFFITLLIGFIIYEVLAITIGVIKKKKQQKKSIESEEINNDNFKQDN